MKNMLKIKMLLSLITINELTMYLTLVTLTYLYMPIMLVWVIFTIVFRIMTLNHELLLIMQRSLKNGLSGVIGFEKHNIHYNESVHFKNALDVNIKDRFNMSGSTKKKTIPHNSVLRFSHLNQNITENLYKNSTVFKHSFNMVATLLTIIPTSLMVNNFAAPESFTIIVSISIIIYFILFWILKTQLDIRALHIKSIAEKSACNKYNSQMLDNVVCMSEKYK